MREIKSPKVRLRAPRSALLIVFYQRMFTLLVPGQEEELWRGYRTITVPLSSREQIVVLEILSYPIKHHEAEGRGLSFKGFFQKAFSEVFSGNGEGEAIGYPDYKNNFLARVRESYEKEESVISTTEEAFKIVEKAREERRRVMFHERKFDPSPREGVDR